MTPSTVVGEDYHKIEVRNWSQQPKKKKNVNF